jgi:acyl carrier protein
MEIRNKIIEIISFHSDMENANEYLIQNKDLSKLGMTSISFIRMVVDLEAEFGFEFEDEALDFNKYTSLDMLCSYIKDMLRKSNIIYSQKEKTDEDIIRSTIIQMVSELTDIPLTTNDLSVLPITGVEVQSLINNISNKFNVSLNQDLIGERNLYLLDNLSAYILNNR